MLLLGLVCVFFTFLLNVFLYLLELLIPVRFRDSLPSMGGNFKPVRAELDVAHLLPSAGRIPSELHGSMYVRNGPNARWATGDRGLLHWFDGDGMLQGVVLGADGARFVNRWVRTPRFKEEERVGGKVFLRLGDFQYNPFTLIKLVWGKVRARLGLTPHDLVSQRGTANTSVAFTARRLLALVENEFGGFHVDARTFETKGLFDFGGALRHPLTAHPKVCPRSGELHFFGYRLDRAPYLSYSVARRDGVLEHSADLPLPRPVMMHDFALSEHFAVFMDLPLVFDKARLARGRGAFAWEPRHGARLGVLPRRGAARDLRWFPVPPGYVFHSANAWEEEMEEEMGVEAGEGTEKKDWAKATMLRVLVCRSARSCALMERDMGAEDVPYLYEWSIDLREGGGATGRRVAAEPLEFPVVRAERLTRAARFVFASRIATDPAGRVPRGELPKFDALLKYDLDGLPEARQVEGKLMVPQVMVFGDKKFGGECSFVPRDEAVEEDDGYLMTYVTDEKTMTSEFWIIDARNLAVLTKIELPQRVPYGFHGMWLSKQEIENSI